MLRSLILFAVEMKSKDDSGNVRQFLRHRRALPPRSGADYRKRLAHFSLPKIILFNSASFFPTIRLHRGEEEEGGGGGGGGYSY